MSNQKNFFLFIVLIIFLITSVKAQAIISEIHYNPAIASQEYVELQILSDNVNLTGWSIQDLDGNAAFIPPIQDVGNFDYITIYPCGNISNSDYDASDGSATIFIGGVPFFDDFGDEVVLVNNNVQAKDFVRYDGGNGDPVLLSWPAVDQGPSAENSQESVQIHGSDFNNGDNWVSASLSIANPNHFDFITQGQIPQASYLLINGVNNPIEIDPNEELFIPNFTIINNSGPFNLSEIRNISEMLNYTYNYLKSRGFNETFSNTIPVIIARSTSGFGSGSSNGTRITVNLVPFTSLQNFIRNKRALEHEQIHVFQYMKNRNWGMVFTNVTEFRRVVGELEGQAEFWGHEIAAAEFNITVNSAIANTSSGVSFIPSWLGNTDLPNNPFFNFTVSGSHYAANHLFLRYIASLFGNQKIVHIHNVRNMTSGMSGVRAIETAVQQQGHNRTFNALLAGYLEWLWRNYGNQITLAKNLTFNGQLLTESGSLNPYGTDYEKININHSSLTSPGPYNITFQGSPGTNYSITILTQSSSGIQREAQVINFTSSITITFTSNITGINEIILIKTQINDVTKPYNVTFKHNGIINSILRGATLINATLQNSSATNSNITSSTILNSTLINSTVINSTVIDSTKINARIINSRDISSTVRNSNETNSNVMNSNITGSRLNNTIVTNSSITGSSISGGSVSGATIVNSTLTGCSITGGTIIGTTICPVACATNSDCIEDGIACTLDFCGPEGFCVRQPSDELCRSGKICDPFVGCILVECAQDIDCNDSNVCTNDRCITQMCTNTQNIYGDVNHDNTVDVFDIFCVLDAFSGIFTETCTPASADLAPCTQDGVIDLFDIFAVLDAFSGIDNCCGGSGNSISQSILTKECTLKTTNAARDVMITEEIEQKIREIARSEKSLEISCETQSLTFK